MSDIMPSVLFITPCYKRYALSAITLRQHKWVHETLAVLGIKSDTVVIADDENLNIARDLGFYTIDTPNDFLGRKFNEGHEYGAKMGYDFLAPVGSDMFLDPIVYSNLNDNFIATNYYAVMNNRGTKFAKMFIGWGVLQIIPTWLTNSLQNRPCMDMIKIGCDSYTRIRIMNREKCVVEFQKNHPLECVSFQSNENQITNFNKLCKTYHAQITGGDTQDLLEPLRRHFRNEDVDKIIKYYESGQ